MNMRSMIRSLAFLVVLAAPSLALAQVKWSSVGAGCAAGDPAIQGNHYLITAGSVKHRSTSVDQITLYCPIAPNQSTGANAFSLTYQDSTGFSTSANIRATLIRMDRNNGATSTVATIDSNGSGTTTATRTWTFGTTFGDVANMNWDQYYYYVRVDLDRSLATEAVILFGVALEYIIT